MLHPSPDRLWDQRRGEGTPETALHLETCDTCRSTMADGGAFDRALQEAATVGPSLSPGDRRRIFERAVASSGAHGRIRRWTWRLGSAAAALVLASAGWGVFRSSRAGAPEPVLAGRVVSTGGSRPVEAERDLRLRSGEVMILEDGTRIVPEGEVFLRLIRPPRGERLALQIGRGGARLDVAKGGAVVVGSPLGSVRVLGTRFWVRVTSDLRMDGGPALLMSIDVEEGTVEIDSPEGRITLSAGDHADVVHGARRLQWGSDVPAIPYWTERIGDRLGTALRTGRREEIALAAAEFRRLGATGARMACQRILDADPPLEERLAWVRVLRFLGPVHAAPAWGRIRDALAGEPDLLAQALAVMGE